MKTDTGGGTTKRRGSRRPQARDLKTRTHDRRDVETRRLPLKESGAAFEGKIARAANTSALTSF